MKELFEQYGGVIITLVAITALVLVVKAIIGTGAGSPVYDAFNSVVNGLKTVGGITTTP